jgi:polysaccharide pyruvyl transferase WcaK-like protein
MRFNLPLELWDEIECPILFYGLSYRTWPRQHYHHADKLQEAIRYAVQSDRCLFSVRNDGTREWLRQRLGIDTDGIQVVPDPAVFVEVNEQVRPWNLHSEKINIAVSFNDEDAHHRFSSSAVPWQNRITRSLHPSRRVRRRARQRSDRRMDFVLKMADMLDHLVDHFPVQIILCPHHHEDFRMIADFLECCSSRLKHQIVLVNGLPKSECAREFYNFYKHVDLTLAMRVHSMSPSIGLGTPTLALCSQPRMIDFMRDAGLSDYALDIFASDLGPALRRACQQILADATGARQAARDAAIRMRARTQEFNVRLERLLSQQVQHA